MSVTTTCRDLSELLPVAQTACKLLFQECYKAGIRNIFITETYRSQERQNYLYAQGRTRPGQPVTWTLNSNHKSRLAWDIAVGPPNVLYDVTVLNKVGAIAQKLGITWGGQKSWIDAGKTDRPHFEVPSTWKMPAGYKLEGQVIVPSNSKLKVQLIIEDKKEANAMPNIWNPASPAMQTAAEQYLAQAVKDGIIQASHLKDLQNKQMTTDRLFGLYITIQQRRSTVK
ncbi:M15 family metallopeptidase [Metasolibacillus sp.]|uniref:M15 family metallopeptidase n=1 Tax=Metasolibacillus sp. TaxID=2703680 RepID=UPI0025E3B184|nr:M15 family metallopeptidase [Metasolibacillus sp.]MCT6925596.1 M15 family metallopeptidase [Metasolibacillus sp.]MCT6941751.1 M15 family metallopeptidase [Metasolibacillus sp.]